MIPSLLNLVSSGASGEVFNMTYCAVLSNRPDIFAAIVQDVCNGYTQTGERDISAQWQVLGLGLNTICLSSSTMQRTSS